MPNQTYFAMNADSSTVLSLRQEGIPWNTQVSTAKRACPPRAPNPSPDHVPSPKTLNFPVQTAQAHLQGPRRFFPDTQGVVWIQHKHVDSDVHGMRIRPMLLLTLPGQAWNSEEFGNSKFKPGIQGCYKGVSVSVEEFLSIFWQFFF